MEVFKKRVWSSLVCNKDSTIQYILKDFYNLQIEGKIPSNHVALADVVCNELRSHHTKDIIVGTLSAIRGLKYVPEAKDSVSCLILGAKNACDINAATSTMEQGENVSF
jgi:hypothetical protein